MGTKKAETKRAKPTKKTEKPAAPKKKDPPAIGTKVKFTLRGENRSGIYKGIKKPTSSSGRGNYERARVESEGREVLVALGSMSW